MENKLRNLNHHKCISNSQPPNNSLALGMHKDSHRISKTKPKIRIIHIFAPEIIKTDAENFRELVQKLTGKPSGEKKYCKKKKKASTEEESRSTSSGGSVISEDSPSMRNGGILGLDLTVKEEEVGGGYLGGFSDLEGFISEIGGAFPLLPLDATHMQVFQESQLLYNRIDA